MLLYVLSAAGILAGLAGIAWLLAQPIGEIEPKTGAVNYPPKPADPLSHYAARWGGRR